MSTSLLQEELLEPPVTLKAPLSPRQRNTLNRLLEGESEKEVAKEMGLSHHTVHI
jgi:DNA-binding CsgD family transcriptional regulator